MQGQTLLLPQYPLILSSVLPTIADVEYEVRDIAVSTSDIFRQLVQDTVDPDFRPIELAEILQTVLVKCVYMKCIVVCARAMYLLNH